MACLARARSPRALSLIDGVDVEAPLARALSESTSLIDGVDLEALREALSESAYYRGLPEDARLKEEITTLPADLRASSSMKRTTDVRGCAAGANAAALPRANATTTLCMVAAILSVCKQIYGINVVDASGM